MDTTFLSLLRSIATIQPLHYLKRSALLALLGMYVPFAAALGLGELNVNSAVGERFYGIIKLSGSERLGADQVFVTLASRSVYNRMGVEWEYFHTGLIFDILPDENGQLFVRVVSKDIVYEPFLDFVVTMRWPKGYITKSYTALMDMAPIAPSPQARVAEPPPVPRSEPQTVTGSVVRRSAEPQQSFPGASSPAPAEPVSRPVSAPPPRPTRPMATIRDKSDRSDSKVLAEGRSLDGVVSEAKPPVSSSNTQASRPVPVTSTPVAQKAPEPTVTTQPAFAEPKPPPKPKPKPRVSGPAEISDAQASLQHETRYGDHLWKIARAMQAQHGGSVSDYADAIFRHNPDAFMGNDKNRLRQNAKLRVTLQQVRAQRGLRMQPTAPAPLEFDVAEKAASAPSDNESTASGSETAEASSSSANNNPVNTTPAAGQGDVLKLVAPEDIGSVALSPEAELLVHENRKTVSKLNRDLAGTAERGQALEERMKNLIDRYEALSEKTEELRNLEADLSGEGGTVPETPSIAVPTTSPLSTDALAENAELDSEQVEQAEAQESNAIAWYWIVTALVGTISLLLLLLRSQAHRGPYADKELSPLPTHTAETGRFDIPDQREEALRDLTEMADAELPDGNDSTTDDFAQQGLPVNNWSKAPYDKVSAAAPTNDDGASSATSSEIESGFNSDESAELAASVYLAYGRYDEAEKVLRQGLLNEPDNDVLLAMLDEVRQAKLDAESLPS